MASPFGKTSTFTGVGDGFKRFGNEQTNPFQQSGSGSSAFGTSQTPASSSIFGGSITTHSVGTSCGQFGFSTPHESTPPQFAPALPVAPASHPFGQASNFSNGFGFGRQTNPFGAMALGGSVSASHTGNSVSGGAATNPFRPAEATPFASSGFRASLGTFESASKSPTFGPSSSFGTVSCGDLRPNFGKNRTLAWPFNSNAGPGSGTTSSGLSSSEQNANAVISMDDDKLMSISATPSCENSSPEELRWEEYQTKTRAASKLTFQVVPWSSFGQPNLVDNSGASYAGRSSTPSTLGCQFCANTGSKAVSATMPSPGFSTCLSERFGGTPSSPSVLASSCSSPFVVSKVTPASSPSGSSGMRNQSETSPSVLGSYSSLFDSPIGVSKFTPASTLFGPPSGSSGIRNQSETTTLGWGHSSSQSSGQLSFLSPASNSNTPSIIIASPATTVLDSQLPFLGLPSTTGMTSMQWPLVPAPVSDPFGVLPGTPSLVSNVPNVGSSSSVHYGISSLPVSGKCSQPRTTSWLTSRHIFQRSVIRMPARRHRSTKKDVPKVSFLDDNRETPDFRNLDPSFVPRENPRALSIHDLPVGNYSKENGSQKECSILEQSSIQSSLMSFKPAEVKLPHSSLKLAEFNLPLSSLDDVNHADGSDPKLSEMEAIHALMPKVNHPDYYIQPNVEELAQKERAEPGYCHRVQDFVVGRYSFGFLKFLGETDVCGLDLGEIIKFERCEVHVYIDDKGKPPVGFGLNKPAEITMFNVKCGDKKTGEVHVDEGPEAQNFESKLKRKTEEQGAEFLSYNAAKGEWRFCVKHFNR